MNIRGRNVTLRAIERDDIPALHRWSNDPDIQNNLGGWHFPLSKASIEKWVESFQHDSRDQRLVIEAATTGAIGLVTLTSISWKDRNAFHGVMIGERQHRRKGFAADATVAVMRYAFEDLGLERLDTTIIEYNTASLRLHIDKCGWKEEGRKEAAVFRHNKFWANVVLGLTRDNYARNVTAGRYAELMHTTAYGPGADGIPS